MTSPLLTAALTGIPPSPLGDGQPGYTALFADVPYDFIGPGAFGVGLPGFPYYGPSAIAALSGSGLLPPTPINTIAPRCRLRAGSAPADGVPAGLLGPGADRQPEDRLPGRRPEILGPIRRRSRTRRSRPGGFTQPPNVRSTVLRTNALKLAGRAAGTQVDLASGTGAPPGSSPPASPTGQGSQNVIIGKSGGEANLFGNIPGKGYGIDVTVTLTTKINSIIRIQDQDLWELPLEEDDEYPAGLFNCRQVWTGEVDNYIPGIRLTGNLRISPAITKDGKLRIAKALGPDRVSRRASR